MYGLHEKFAVLEASPSAKSQTCFWLAQPNSDLCQLKFTSSSQEHTFALQMFFTLWVTGKKCCLFQSFRHIWPAKSDRAFIKLLWSLLIWHLTAIKISCFGASKIALSCSLGEIETPACACTWSAMRWWTIQTTENESSSDWSSSENWEHNWLRTN